MAEFTELPCALGELPKDDWWDELRTAIINRQEVSDAIYNTSLSPASNPVAASVGDLWKRIAAYRTAIDAMAGRFYTSGSSGTVYTSETLHNAAFGQNDWREISFPGSPRKILWNDMKACLDLMIWAGKTNSTPREVDAFEYNLEVGDTDANWNTARSTSFSNVVQAENPAGSTNILGRYARARLNASYSVSQLRFTLRLSQTFATFDDYAGLSNPPSVDDGYFMFTLDPDSSPGGQVDHFPDYDIDLSIEGQVLSGGPYTITPSHDTEVRLEQIDSTAIAAINLDTTNNEVIFDYVEGAATDDPGATAWPAPPGAAFENFQQYMKYIGWAIILKHAW